MISSVFASGEKILSFEFFPPREGQTLSDTQELIADLAKLRPHFMTVTYGAGGRTRHNTVQLVDYIQNSLLIPAVAHLTCVDHSVADIDEILDKLQQCGVTSILALRGDPPRGESRFKSHPDGFSCARDLTRFIKAGGKFDIAVAGYPEIHQEAVSVDADLDYLKEKVDAGASCIITQLFFRPELYFDFVARVRSVGIDVPVLPGIMPIANVSQVKRFTTMCGASLPDKLLNELKDREGDKDAVIDFGIDYACNLSKQLLEGGAPGIHFYTLNRSVQARPIVERLGLGKDSESQEVKDCRDSQSLGY